jgi:capsular polysaccharide biosynthesis protein
MEQRVEILRESHREFLRKVNQAELAEAVESAQQGERATILDAAFPPNKPVSSPVLAIIATLVGSFGAAVALAILLELVDGVIVTSDEIERNYGLTVLSSIPKLD